MKARKRKRIFALSRENAEVLDSIEDKRISVDAKWLEQKEVAVEKDVSSEGVEQGGSGRKRFQ